MTESEVKVPEQLYPAKLTFLPLEEGKKFIIRDVPESELKAAVGGLPKFHLRKRY